MTKELAIRLRTIIAALLETEHKREWTCAVNHNKHSDAKDDWELHLFSRVNGASDYCDLTLLAHFIESMGIGVLFIASEYDMGTTIPKNVKSWMLF